MSGFRHLKVVTTTIALLVIQSYCNKCHRSKFLFDRLYSGLVLVIHTTLPRTLWCWEIPVVLTTRVWNNIFWCQWIRKQLHFTVDITKISINIFLIQNSGLRIYSGSVFLFWERERPSTSAQLHFCSHSQIWISNIFFPPHWINLQSC